MVRAVGDCRWRVFKVYRSECVMPSVADCRGGGREGADTETKW